MSTDTSATAGESPLSTDAGFIRWIRDELAIAYDRRDWMLVRDLYNAVSFDVRVTERNDPPPAPRPELREPETMEEARDVWREERRATNDRLSRSLELRPAAGEEG